MVQSLFSSATDLALYNEVSLTLYFSFVYSVLGLGLVAGPLVGGFIISYDLKFGFLFAMCLCILALIVNIFFIEETYHINRKNGKKYNNLKNISYKKFLKKVNPFPRLIKYFKNERMRDLTLPLFIICFVSGSYSMIYIYMDYRYNSPSYIITLYIALLGLGMVLAQGLALPKLVPKYLSEGKTAVYALIFHAAMYLGNTLSIYSWIMFAVLPFTVFCYAADPVMKSIIVANSFTIDESKEIEEERTRQDSTDKKEDEEEDAALIQGNLQGILSSVKTLGIAIGSLFYTNFFSFSIHIGPGLPYLPYVVSIFFYLIASRLFYIACNKHNSYYDLPKPNIIKYGDDKESNLFENNSKNVISIEKITQE